MWRTTAMAAPPSPLPPSVGPSRRQLRAPSFAGDEPKVSAISVEPCLIVGGRPLALGGGPASACAEAAGAASGVALTTAVGASPPRWGPSPPTARPLAGLPSKAGAELFARAVARRPDLAA